MEDRNPSKYSRAVKLLSWSGAVATLILSIAVLVLVVGRAIATDDGGGIAEKLSEMKALVGLAFLPIGGYLLGMAVAIVIAPASFLECEEGKRWMRKVGTKSIGATRMVALIFALFAFAFVAFVVLALATNDFKHSIF